MAKKKKKISKTTQKEEVEEKVESIKEAPEKVEKTEVPETSKEEVVEKTEENKEMNEEVKEESEESDSPKEEESLIEKKEEPEGVKKIEESSEDIEDDVKEAPKKSKSIKEKVLRKKEKSEDKESTADENEDGYVSAREVVNTIDKDHKEEERSEDEILADQVAEQLKKDADYFIFRIRKSIALMVVGVIILSLWIIPLSPFIKSKLGMFPANNTEGMTSPTPSPTPEVKKTMVRIKTIKNDDKVASISSLLTEKGDYQIDVLESEVEESGVSVAVKKGDDKLREELLSLLEETYKASSSSSELTSDSDFSAVILVGK